MKKIVITLAIILSGAMFNNANVANAPAEASSSLFMAGTNLFSAHVALPIATGFTPFFSANYERILVDLGYNIYLGAGAEAGYVGYKYQESYLTENYEIKYKNSIYSIFKASVFTDVHYTLIDALDIYAGASLGYVFNQNNIASLNFYSGFVGARYFFTNNIAVGVRYGQWGTISAGFTFKF